MVAIERPTATREIQLSCRQRRAASSMGKTDLKPQPAT